MGLEAAPATTRSRDQQTRNGQLFSCNAKPYHVRGGGRGRSRPGAIAGNFNGHAIDVQKSQSVANIHRGADAYGHREKECELKQTRQTTRSALNKQEALARTVRNRLRSARRVGASEHRRPLDRGALCKHLAIRLLDDHVVVIQARVIRVARVTGNAELALHTRDRQYKMSCARMHAAHLELKGALLVRDGINNVHSHRSCGARGRCHRLRSGAHRDLRLGSFGFLLGHLGCGVRGRRGPRCCVRLHAGIGVD